MGLIIVKQIHLHYLNEWWPFLWQDDGLTLYQQLTELQLPPAHDLGQSIPWLHNQQMNIQIHWLPLSTFHLISIITNRPMPFYHNNKPVPPEISSAKKLFVVWNHINDGWICFNWLRIFLFQKTAHWRVEDVNHSVRPHMIALELQPSWLQPHPCYLKILIHWRFPGKAKPLSWKMRNKLNT